MIVGLLLLCATQSPAALFEDQVNDGLRGSTANALLIKQNSSRQPDSAASDRRTLNIDSYGCNVQASKEAMKYSAMILNIRLRDAGLQPATVADVFSKRLISDGQALTAYPCFTTMGEVFEAIVQSAPYAQLKSGFRRPKELRFIFDTEFTANLRGFYSGSKGNPLTEASMVADIFQTTNI